jgi:hypothetical protein
LHGQYLNVSRILSPGDSNGGVCIPYVVTFPGGIRLTRRQTYAAKSFCTALLLVSSMASEPVTVLGAADTVLDTIPRLVRRTILGADDLEAA